MEIEAPPLERVIEASPSPSPSPPPARRSRKGRSQAQSKFKGFTVDSDDSDDGKNATSANTQQQGAAAQSQGMFMTQQSDVAMNQVPGPTSIVSQRKRPAPEPERELMDSVAPTVARFKRQRLETGQDHPAVEKSPSPEPEPPAPAPAKRGRAAAAAGKKPGRKGNKGTEDSGDEFLNQLVQTGQEEEANRQAEDELVRKQLFENEIDFGTIREATAVQTVAIRRRPVQVAAEHGEARWDDRWNGLKNFKKFRSQADKDAPRARVQPKKIISLEPVRPKEYGLSDDYWLQDDDKRSKKGRSGNTQTQTTQDKVSQRRAKQSQLQQQQQVVVSDSDHEVLDDDDDDASLPDVMDAPPPPAPQARSRKGKVAERASQQATQKTTRAKRAAVASPAAEKPAKRSRIAQASEDDDSEDGGIGFRFGKRK